MQLTIATAKSRKSKSWKNQTVTWDALVGKLTSTVYSNESVQEYTDMRAEQRSRIKDAYGGFVAGELRNGSRRKSDVVNRSCICLDADYATKNFVERAESALKPWVYVMYTTHSHTAAKPRWRIVVPLSKAITPDMYEPLARAFTDSIGMSFFDPTTYDVNRLMYFPSTPKDGEFIALTNPSSSAPCDAEAFLADRYSDWRDVAQWPQSDSEIRLYRRKLGKQADPLTKPGLIGAFNRVYRIADAIEEFLPGVYVPTGTEGRWTYAGGTTVGGGVEYDDGVFFYSHHATDPAGGRLCNAFDLVRLHLYGEMDQDAKDDTPVNRLPSYAAMQDYARTMETVVAEVVENKEPGLTEDDLAGMDAYIDEGQIVEVADAPAPAEEKKSNAWKGKFELNAKGNGITNSAKNVLIILRNDERLKGTVGLDTFANRIAVKKKLPWREVADNPFWTDADDARLRNFLANAYGIIGRSVIDDALTEYINESAFHPVRDYLDSLTWDGKKRIPTLLHDFLGAKNTEYTKAVIKCWLTAAVKRVYEPGCKFDYCLVLAGPQGIGKTSILNWLGGKWFSDSLYSLNGRDAMDQLQGSWLIELGEMQATTKAENETVKAFISKREDSYRAAYGRRTEIKPRQCIFAGTTNDYEFLKDRTGARRFWVVRVRGKSKLGYHDMTEELRRQILAEAVQMYKDGFDTELPDSVKEAAREIQAAHTEGSEKVGLIMEYLGQSVLVDKSGMTPEDIINYELGDDPKRERPRRKVCALEIWVKVLGGTVKAMRNADAREINTILASIPGWAKYKDGRGKLQFEEFGLQRAYIKVVTKIGKLEKKS